MRLADEIARGVAEWHDKYVEPTHIVLSREALATLADEEAIDPAPGGPFTLWGFPVITAGFPTGWAIGTTNPQHAHKVLPLP